MTDVAAAIKRAQGWLAFLEREDGHDCDCTEPDVGHGEECRWLVWVNGEDDTRDNLAELGPPSVAVVARFAESSRAYHELHPGHFTHPDSPHASYNACRKEPCVGDRQALADWADAQDG